MLTFGLRFTTMGTDVVAVWEDSSSSCEFSQLRVIGFFLAAIGAMNFTTREYKAPCSNSPTRPALGLVSTFKSSDARLASGDPSFMLKRSRMRNSSTMSSNLGPSIRINVASPCRNTSRAASSEGDVLMRNSGHFRNSAIRFRDVSLSF